MGDLPDWTREVAVTIIFPSPGIITETPKVTADRYSGSSATYEEVVSWTVATGKTGILQEVTIYADEYDYAEWKLTVAGDVLFEDLQIQTALSIPFDNLGLEAGDEVKVEVKSDGSQAIVADAVITGKELQ